MASRKLNVLLYAFTGEAETLQSGSSGMCEESLGFIQCLRLECLSKWQPFRIQIYILFSLKHCHEGLIFAI